MNGSLECHHTSDWWKNMANCFACGQRYSEQEAHNISSRLRTFTPAQQDFIDKMESEADHA